MMEGQKNIKPYRVETIRGIVAKPHVEATYTSEYAAVWCVSLSADNVMQFCHASRYIYRVYFKARRFSGTAGLIRLKRNQKL